MKRTYDVTMWARGDKSAFTNRREAQEPHTAVYLALRYTPQGRELQRRCRAGEATLVVMVDLVPAQEQTTAEGQ